MSQQQQQKQKQTRRQQGQDLLRNAALASLLVVITLVIGMIGYRYLEDMEWIDAFANAAMILGGMGPFGPMKYSAAKIFAGLYALLSGLVFISLIAIIISPILHAWLSDLGFERPSSTTHHRRLITF